MAEPAPGPAEPARYELACASCGHEFTCTDADFRWSGPFKKSAGQPAPQTYIACPACGERTNYQRPGP